MTQKDSSHECTPEQDRLYHEAREWAKKSAVESQRWYKECCRRLDEIDRRRDAVDRTFEQYTVGFTARMEVLLAALRREIESMFVAFQSGGANNPPKLPASVITALDAVRRTRVGSALRSVAWRAGGLLPNELMDRVKAFRRRLLG
ncbi:MAG: hypothetical protein KAI47_13315 [Deltaproteobacteria bacterium]|nr:hypothetical protein [Deltaproteobacteria bacterium]